MMKTMKSSMKCLIAVFVMAMAFMVTGITSEAAVSGLKQTYDYTNSVTVGWTASSNYKYYGYQIASDAGFKNIIKQSYTSGSRASFSGLAQGSTYYVRVGCGTTYKNCYANWTGALQVVTTPGALSDVKFVNATDNSATIQYSAPGANIYYIYEGGTNKLVGSTTSTSYTIKMNSSSNNSYKVVAARRSASGYNAEAIAKYTTVNLLTSKISKSNFGLYGVLSATNKISVVALFSGTGFEAQIVNAGGSKYSKSTTVTKSYSYNGTSTPYMSYKQNKYLKYRVRAFVDTDNGRKYGQWSDYRAFCEMNVKYTRSSKKINFKWSKINGTGKIRTQVSTKKSSGYKTFKTLSGSTKKVTVNKYGKSSLKKNKSYYFKIVPLVKINGKYVASDYYGQQKIKVR